MSKITNFHQAHPANYQARIEQLFSLNYLLITLCSGTGYGKTRTVLSYVNSVDANVIWMSNTNLTNNQQQFWGNFISSVKTLNEKLADYLTYAGFPDSKVLFHAFAKRFMAEVGESKPYVIVFDDYHLLTDKTIREFIENLILMNNKNLTVIIISRETVIFDKISQYAVARKNISSMELSYTLEETKQVFQERNIHCDDNTIEHIHRKTEGWPFAIRLIDFSQEEYKDISEPLFDIIQRKIFEVLEQEILKNFTFKEQQLIIILSHVKLLPTELLDLLIEQGVISEKLIAKATENLVSYNPHTKCYRVYDIVCEYLKQRGAINLDKQTAEIYKICGDWFVRHNYVINAVFCYDRISDYDSINTLLLKIIPEILSKDTAEQLLNYIVTIPPGYVEENPHIEVSHAMLYFFTFDFQTLSELLNKLIDKLENKRKSLKVRTALGDAYLNMAIYQMMAGDCGFCDSIKKSYQYHQDRSQFSKSSYMLLRNGFTISLDNGDAGKLDAWVKAVESSMLYYDKVVDRGYGYGSLVKAEAAYLRGDMVSAREHAAVGLMESELKNQIDIFCTSCALINRIELASGNYEGAVLILEKMKKKQAEGKTPPAFRIPDVAGSWFYVKMHRFEQISKWISDEDIYNHSRVLITIGKERLVYGDILIEQGNYIDLISFAKTSESLFQLRSLHLMNIYVYMQLAIAYDRIKNADKAYEYFKLVYEGCYKNDIVMPIVEYAKYTRLIITEVKKREKCEIPDAWLEDINKRALNYQNQLNKVKRDCASNRKEGANVLSRREQEILTHMCMGRTREQIAEELSISLNTVKTTLANIYSKLGAFNSTHAANIATAKGLLLR